MNLKSTVGDENKYAFILNYRLHVSKSGGPICPFLWENLLHCFNKLFNNWNNIHSAPL